MDTEAGASVTLSSSLNNTSSDVSTNIAGVSAALSIKSMAKSIAESLTTKLATALSSAVSLILNKSLSSWTISSVFASLGKPFIFHSREDELPSTLYSRGDSLPAVFYSAGYGIDRLIKRLVKVNSNLNRRLREPKDLVEGEKSLEVISMDKSDSTELTITTNLTSAVA